MLTDPASLANGRSTHLNTIDAEFQETVASVGADLAQGLERADGQVATAVGLCHNRAAEHNEKLILLDRARDGLGEATDRLRYAAVEADTAIARRLGDRGYYILLVLLALADVVVLSSVFQVLGEGIWMTRLLAFVFAISLELLASFAGAELHRYQHTTGPVAAHRWFPRLVVAGIIVIVIGVLATTVIRQQFLQVTLTGLDLAIPSWAVAALQIPILAAALLIGYLHANAFLDDVEHWEGVERRAQRKVNRARRKLAGAVVDHRKAWEARRSYMEAQLRVIDAHRARATRVAQSWLADNGLEVIEADFEHLTQHDDPAWVSDIRSDHRLTGNPDTEIPELPELPAQSNANEPDGSHSEPTKP